ncbi:polysaccharide pyruvyl transferase family protein [Agrobacterium tumefaciens]|uniref:polysaccharide pyruvyl transferase family protein n=1 Tax=Agrobacterium tumefaciens TaxID=358 RepID=UPI000DCFA5CE
MKTAAMFGTDGGVSFAVEGFQNALRRVGENTGNTLFQRAMWDLVPGPKICAGPGVLAPGVAKQVADVLVIPAANQINPHFKMDAWTSYIQDSDMPCVVVGLGAQSDDPSLSPEDLILPEGVKEFANAIAARTETIGVRGEFTKRVLATLGVTNTVVTGCPSQTLNIRVSGQTIAKNIEKAKENSSLIVALLCGTLQDYTRAVEKNLYTLFKDSKHHTCIYQTEPRVLRFIHERHVDGDTRAFFIWMNKVVRPDLNLDQFFHYMAIHGRFYSDARSWIDAMRRADLAIGMRIHGAVAAIQAGKLGVCVAFDSRTLELAQTMGVPYVRATDIQDGMSLVDILDQVQFNADEFEQKRSANIEAIRKIMKTLD